MGPTLDAATAELVRAALAEDVGAGDVTTAATVSEQASAHALITQKAPGVVYGLHAAEIAFALLDPDARFERLVAEGVWREQGGPVLSIAGRARALLTGERTALNFLAHLSGVATLAARAAREVQGTGARVLDTRKTTPGLRALEKAAVRAGGAWNHRAGLSDAVLVKDNHLGRLGVTEAVALARRWWPGRMVEVECDRPEQVSEAVDAGASAVLLDNMTPSLVSECVALVRARTADAPGTVLVEASGGVTLASAPAYAAAGADLISVGAITHSAPVLDLGLDLVED